MLIRELKGIGFRNFESVSVSFAPGLNVFHGRNGSGKTNLLESIFVLLLGRSQRGAVDSVMLKENEEYYRLSGEIEIDGKSEEAAIAYQKGGRKKITIDKVSVRASELFRHYCAVATSPEDLEILAGAPSKRRIFLDIYLAQASPSYLADLTDYQKVLAQKNAFLKQQDNRGDTPYDDLLVDYGSRITKYRAEFLGAIYPAIEESYARVSDGHKMTVDYRSSVMKEDTDFSMENISITFRKRLKEIRGKERVMQSALCGPHRDDIDFAVRDMAARNFGSQGELRTAAVALKVAVYRYLKKVRKVNPVLLMDEIFAELDERRREMMIELFDEVGQVFITTASKIPDILDNKGRKFLIEQGTIKEVEG